MPISLNNAKTGLKLETAEARTERIKKALQSDIKGVIRYLFPKAVFSGHEARIGDVYGTKGMSLSIKTRPLSEAGLWVDHATSGDQGDIFSLWMAAQGIHEFSEALNEIDAWIGGAPTPRQEQHGERVKKQKAEKDPETKKRKAAEYLYTDVHGAKVCLVTKYDIINQETGEVEDKSFTIFRFSDKKWAAPPIRPLYRLPDIANVTDVVLVEGEKCADALASQGIEATTASGGSNTILEKTDWTPLAGKTVFLWPDNDPVGKEYMARVGEYLESIGCEVHHVPVPKGKPKGWDAADALEEGEDIVSILRTALPERDTGGIRVERWHDIIYEHEGELLEDLFPRVGVATIFGPSTGGKSFTVLDLIVRIATGEEIFKRETEPCAVALLAFEGYDGLRKRIHGLKQEREIDDVDIDLIDAPWTLRDERQWNVFEAWLYDYQRDVEERTGHRLGCIVIDTLTSATAGADTNSQADVTAAMKRLKRLAVEMGLLIINVGHTGKESGRGMVGSFAYKSEADVFLEVQVDLDEDTGRVRNRSLYVDKVKDGASGYVLADFSLEVVTIGHKANGKPVTTCVVRWRSPANKDAHQSPSEKVLEYGHQVLALLLPGARTTQELADEMQLSRTRISEVMKHLTRSGKVWEETINKRKIWHLQKDAAGDEE
jgi:5S rRNA maturation endonuclease (ribonuclease M5)